MEIIDSKVDIFSFGLVIYETLALVPPHTLELDAALGEDLENSHDLAPDNEKLQRKLLNYSDIESNGEAAGVQNEYKEDTEMSDEHEVAGDDDQGEEDIPDYSLNNLQSAYGTRPPLPVAFQLSDDYNCIVELFYLCTNALSEDRPAAKTIWQCLENNAANMATVD